MLDLNFVRQNLELVKVKSAQKGVILDTALFESIDQQRRKLVTEMESIRSRRKTLAKEIGAKKREHQPTQELESESSKLAERLKSLATDSEIAEEKFRQFVLGIPNIFDDSVPIGESEADNVEVRSWGEKPWFDFQPKPHWELGESKGWFDFSRATKIASSRFALYLGQLAKLERILIQFMLDIHTMQNGYIEVLPPFLANDESLIGTGNLPKFKNDLFKIEGYNLFLIPTAEVPLTNIYRDETLSEKDLPINYVAYSPCFRSEAGSYGKDIRGIIRQHQFNKVELLKFTTPESSFTELEKLTGHAESILKLLQLPYRVVVLCSKDLSFQSAKTYDIEVWMPARQKYMEISSCSNFRDFQARRARIKFLSNQGKRDYVHTLNGSGLAIGRTVAAIMENYQIREGEVKIPQVLKKYFSDREFL